MAPIVCCRRLATASGRVCFVLSVSRMRGAKKSLHAARKANRPTVMSPGRTEGRRIRHRTPNVPQPSTSPDSSSSRGTASNEIRHHVRGKRELEHRQYQAEANQGILQPKAIEEHI